MLNLRILRNIFYVLTESQRRTYLAFWRKSMAFALLDLVSVAYLIPVILLVINEEKARSIMVSYGLNENFLSTDHIRIGTGFLVLFFLGKNLLQARHNRRIFHFLFATANQLSLNCVSAFLHGSYLNFQKQNKGTIIQQVMKVATDFCRSILHSLVLISSEMLAFTVFLCALFFLYPQLTLLALLGLTAFSVLLYQVKKQQMNLFNDTFRQNFARANSKLLNILDGFLEIKSSRNSGFFLHDFSQYNRSLNRASALLYSSNLNYSKYLETAIVIGICSMVYFNGGNQKSDEVLLITVLAAISIKMIPSLSKVLGAITLFRSHFHTIEILRQIKRNETQTNVVEKFSYTMKLEKVSFGYDDENPLFENLDLEVMPGQIIGVKGYSGSGKTSLLYLLLGLLKPCDGRVRIDEVTMTGLYSLSFVSYVPQQPFLFNGSLLQNVVMGQSHEQIDHDYINYLTTHLHLRELVESLPEQLLTEVSHNSMRFSGGEKQRLALLRALYNRPRLLLLDEATNQQNTEYKTSIYAFLRQLTRENNMAVVSVSHQDLSNLGLDHTYELRNRKLNEV